MIPVYEPFIDKTEKEMAFECIDSKWLSGEGPHVKRFEREVARYTGVKHSVATSSGTSALEVALHAIGISSGDEVIIPALTNIACAISVIRVGAKPVLVDVIPENWGINTKKIEEKITSKTKAIMVVHLFGHPVKMDDIYPLAKKFNLKIVEDCAQAFGALYKGKKVGSLGDIAAFSFYGNKIITTGEGGMVCTSNTDYATRASSYRNLYFGQEDKFLHSKIGYNFRMSNIQAAIGLAQLKKIDWIVKRKRAIARLYREELPGLSLNLENSDSRSVFWMNFVLMPPDFPYSAKEIIGVLAKNGVETRPFFQGLHVQPALINVGLFNKESYPITEHASENGFYLPSGPTLVDKEIKFVCEKIRNLENITI
ncbi:MAG: aminotransferase DegT [Epsilonproteobacteria bacterium]|nr:MAG: aminotransferase DegT [Campylobacterota bacterium]